MCKIVREEGFRGSRVVGIKSTPAQMDKEDGKERGGGGADKRMGIASG